MSAAGSRLCGGLGTFLCSSGARTSALQTPVVAFLGAGDDLSPLTDFKARSGQATRRLHRSSSHTADRPSRELPSSRFPTDAPVRRAHSRKPRSMARSVQRTLLRSALLKGFFGGWGSSGVVRFPSTRAGWDRSWGGGAVGRERGSIIP